jgi:hypothetical protein
MSTDVETSLQFFGGKNLLQLFTYMQLLQQISTPTTSMKLSTLKAQSQNSAFSL